MAKKERIVVKADSKILVHKGKLFMQKFQKNKKIDGVRHVKEIIFEEVTNKDVKETKPIVDLVQSVNNNSEFLYHDTLHSYNDNQSIEEQINQCHRLAKSDIDSLKDLPKVIDEKIAELNKLKERAIKETDYWRNHNSRTNQCPHNNIKRDDEGQAHCQDCGAIAVSEAIDIGKKFWKKQTD